MMIIDEIDLHIKHESKPYLMIPFPENATNGDMVEKIFGKDVYCTLIRMMYSSCCEKLKDWWNAPYEKGE